MAQINFIPPTRLQIRKRPPFLFRKGGAAHFWLPGCKEKTAYTYIRKNACTAFKKLIISQLGMEMSVVDGNEDFKKMEAAKISSIRELKAAQNIIFVYRDPAERIISLFLNKFVEKRGAIDIRKNFKDITGKDPDYTSFNSFLTMYNMQKWKHLDPHNLPQLFHLAPVEYTHAINIKKLNVEVCPVIGVQNTREFFRQRPNASSVGGKSQGDLTDVPAIELMQEAKIKGIPTPSCFLNHSTTDYIKQRYSMDYKMIADIERQSFSN